MKKLFDKMTQDSVTLSGGIGSSVQHDSSGQLTAFRVFPYGPLSITKNGMALEGEFTPDHADIIVANFKRKGSKIPVDSNHMLLATAQKMGVDEAAIGTMTGSNKLAMAFADLEKRADGLWASGIEWLDLGAKLMSEKVFRYFSPVLHGLKDGNLRISSISMLNSPAIDGLDPIVAAAEDNVSSQGFTRIKSLLGLDPASTDDVVFAAVQGLLKKLENYDLLKERVDKLEMSAESENKSKLIKDGLESGKITNSMLEWAKEQTCLALSAFLKIAPSQLSTKKIQLSAPDDTVSLSESDLKVCDLLGLDPVEFAKNK